MPSLRSAQAQEQIYLYLFRILAVFMRITFCI